MWLPDFCTLDDHYQHDYGEIPSAYHHLYSFLFGSIALAVMTPHGSDISRVMDLSFILAAAGYGLIPTVALTIFI